MRVPVFLLSVVTLIAASVFSVSFLTAGGQAGGRGQAAAAAAPAARGQAPAGRGQGAAARGPAGPAIPRTADGKPDLSGVWQVLDTSLDGNIEPHAASYGVHAGQGAIVDPPDGRIPYLPAAVAKREANYKNRAKDPVAYCFKPGVPRITYMPFPFQITQTPTMIQMTYEFVHNYRSVYINGSEHLPGIDFYNGDSRAKWDGDSLVVDVTDLNDDSDHPTWFDASGNYHSDKLHVVERYTRTGPDTMVYRATMDDPKVFSRPWTIEVLLYRHQEKNFRVLEYECQMFKEKLVREGKGNNLRVVENN
jgi:hypothetical protein